MEGSGFEPVKCSWGGEWGSVQIVERKRKATAELKQAESLAISKSSSVWGQETRCCVNVFCRVHSRLCAILTFVHFIFIFFVFVSVFSRSRAFVHIHLGGHNKDCILIDQEETKWKLSVLRLCFETENLTPRHLLSSRFWTTYGISVLTLHFCSLRHSLIIFHAGFRHAGHKPLSSHWHFLFRGWTNQKRPR